MRSEHDQGFVERLRAAVGEESIAAFSKRCRVPAASLAGYLRGENEPTRPTLVKISFAANVSLSWLMTGSGPMRPGEAYEVPPPGAVAATDRELMGRCVDQLIKLYQELGIKLPMLDMGREAADLHDEVLASGATTVDEFLVALRVLIAQKRRALITAPPSGKLQDSA